MTALSNDRVREWVMDHAGEEFSSRDIADAFRVPTAVASYHRDKLRDAGLIRHVRDEPGPRSSTRYVYTTVD